jgi:hypothetical protein
MHEARTMSDVLGYLATSLVYLLRILQFALGAFAVIFVAGALIGDMAALAFVVIGPVAVALLLGVLVVEIPVRAIQRRVNANA